MLVLGIVGLVVTVVIVVSKSSNSISRCFGSASNRFPGNSKSKEFEISIEPQTLDPKPCI